MLNVTGEELLLLAVLAVIILGPRRLPYYAGKLGELVRELRRMAEGAKTQIKEELGPDFDDVDWRQLDPRQYDPRRIVREALAPPSAPPLPATDGVDPQPATALPTHGAAAAHRLFDPSRPVPFDVDAT